ncbi:MAG: hypothetical protein ACR2LL_08700 [Nitrosopumilus sp.]
MKPNNQEVIGCTCGKIKKHTHNYVQKKSPNFNWLDIGETSSEWITMRRTS